MMMMMVTTSSGASCWHLMSLSLGRTILRLESRARPMLVPSTRQQAAQAGAAPLFTLLSLYLDQSRAIPGHGDMTLTQAQHEYKHQAPTYNAPPPHPRRENAFYSHISSQDDSELCNAEADVGRQRNDQNLSHNI